jgi:quinohemoprotein amine dehydrogenase
MLAARTVVPLILALPLLARAQAAAAIPVTDPLVLAKCGTCHPADGRGNMQYISSERATPEGWEDALKRMIRTSRVTLTPPEARAIVKYLSAQHGLSPQEARPVMYYAERRIHDETGIASEKVLDTCAKCHSLGRALSWRRTPDDWKQFVAAHKARYQLPANQEAVSFLAKSAPLDTPEWAAWSAHAAKPELTGRWLVTAHVLGHGKFYGEMEVKPGSTDGEYFTRVVLKSVDDGSTLLRSGHIMVYAGYAWRGRSQGGATPNAPPDDLKSEAREAMWVSPDGSEAEGRWFWGQYQEFGFDVKIQRASSGPTLLAVDPPSLKAGSQGDRIRLIGDKFPAHATPADLVAGPGMTVRRIVSSTPREIVAEVDVAADAALGKRDVTFGSATFKNAVAIYDRVDYVTVTPESSMAAFGDQMYPRGYQQYEAIGYQRGPDGRSHTADDVELGPVDATWSMEVFYDVDGSKRDSVGQVSPTGFFTPAAKNPDVNSDVWVIATAKNDKNSKDGKPLVGKGYLVVTVPTYSFNGHKYVRELDRWIQEGSDTR